MEQIMFYQKMYKIRKFETTLLELFSQNALTGTTHTCIGQEAVAAAVMNQIREEDYVFSNHRCHGHFLAYSDNAEILLSEIMSKKDGVCRSRGGSQHLCWKHFFSNGVQGGIVPNAAGIAFASKRKGSRNVTAVFLGDGTLGQGVVYESFNMAALFHIPVLFIIEDNGYAMTTKVSEGVAGNIALRAQAFGIACGESASNDVETLDKAFASAFAYVRGKGEPYCQIVHTYRLGPHSKGDDFRSDAELEMHWQQDPIRLLKKKLCEQEGTGQVPAVIKQIEQIEKEADDEIQRIVKKCKEKENYEGEADVFRESKMNIQCEGSMLNERSEKCVTQLNCGLDAAMRQDASVVLLGEDIRDPYGGAFKVTKGLSAKYPKRVINTPISEAGVIGLSVGLAMNGMKPVVEIMFGDFLTLGFDQILNHAAKYPWMYADQVKVPLLIRTPMGAGRGYGATHSQSLEKYFAGIPNLTVAAVHPCIDAGILVQRILENIASPVLLIENKKMYGQKQLCAKDGMIGNFAVTESRDLFPVLKLTLDPVCEADAVIITYGAMTDTALRISERLLMEEELLVNVIVCTAIAPLEINTICSYIGHVKAGVTLEEGTRSFGWGAEVIAGLTEYGKISRAKRIAAANSVIPANLNMERRMMPDEERIYETVRRLCLE